MTSARRLFVPPWEFIDEENLEGVPPVYSIKNLDDEKEVLKWAEKAVTYCEQHYRPWHKMMVDNVLIYEGLHWANQDALTFRYLDRQRRVTRRSPRLVINRVAEFTDSWVSRLTRYRAAVKVYPANMEYEDELDAKVSNQVLDYLWYINNKDKLNRTAARLGKICGNVYLFDLWNPSKGDLHPGYVEQLKANGGQPPPRQPVLDSNGMPVMSAQNEALSISKAQFIGDVGEEVVPAWYVWEEPCFTREDINWCIRWKPVDVDLLRCQYPDKAKKLNPDGGTVIFDENYNLNIRKKKHQIIQFELFHQHHEYLPAGRYMKWVKGCLLENSDYPYAHGRLPYTHWGDIEIPNRTLYQSFYQRIFPIQHQLNAITSLIYKCLVLYAHPKFVMQDGACNIEQLVDESTVLTHAPGAAIPQLMTYNPVAAELFTYLQKLEEWLNKDSGVYELSEGKAPSGVRADAALRRLEEQEDKRSFETVTNFNDKCLVDSAKLTLAVAGQFYRDDEERLARVLGRNNEYQIIQFKSSNLAKDYDVRVEQTTALSQSRAGRMQEVINLQQVRFDPQAPFTREQFFESLDLENAEEFKDAFTRALNCARSENEDLLSERFQTVPQPTPDEDLVTHWKTHREATQSRIFKQAVPQQYRQALLNHLLATEYLMFVKAFGTRDQVGMPITQGNVIFSQRLQLECPDWPLLYPLPALNMMQPSIVPGMGSPAPGGANGGGNAKPPQLPDQGPPPLSPPLEPPPMSPATTSPGTNNLQ